MMPPTKAEELVEWSVVYSERLGILCEDREPTAEERAIAKQDADEAVRKMRIGDEQVSDTPQHAEQ